ncbi:MAG: recombinase family protein, partial [Bacteroidales bacterium]
RNLGKAIKKLQEGDTIIVTEISRLSRSLHEIMTIMKHCVDNRITIYSTKDGYTFDDSINSKVLSFAFGLAAEIEHKLISQRTQEALTHLKSQGVILGRRKGSGEKMNKLIASKQEILSYIEDGKTLRWICKRFKISYRTFYRFRDIDKEIAMALIAREEK